MLTTIVRCVQAALAPALAGLLMALATSAWAAWDADASANWALDADGEVLELARQSADGKLLAGGRFTTVSGQPRSRLARFDASGALDPGFTPALDGDVYAVAVDADGKILVGGAFTGYLTRLNGDGTVDPTFHPNINSVVTSIAELGSGKIMIGGVFTQVDGNAHERLARLNIDGTEDAGFANPGIDNYVSALAPDGSGGVYAGGGFTQVGGSGPAYLARLDASGAKVAAFAPVLTGAVAALYRTPGGFLLAGGNFTHASGAPHAQIALLDGATGAAAPAFTVQGDGGSIRALAAQADGDVWVGGGFLNLGGAAHSRVARLDAAGAGSVDATVNSVPIDDMVEAVLPLPDGSVLVGGPFTQAGGQTHGHIVRLAKLPSAPVVTATAGPGQITVTIAAQPDPGVGVDSYVALCAPTGGGAATQSVALAGALPLAIAVSGLAAGTPYQCAAIANSAQGPGPAGPAAAPVTPLAAAAGGGVAAVPTLSEWALALLALACAALGLRPLRQLR